MGTVAFVLRSAAILYTDIAEKDGGINVHSLYKNHKLEYLHHVITTSTYLMECEDGCTYFTVQSIWGVRIFLVERKSECEVIYFTFCPSSSRQFVRCTVLAGASELPKGVLLGTFTAVVTFVLLGGSFNDDGSQPEKINSGRIEVFLPEDRQGNTLYGERSPSSPDGSNPTDRLGGETNGLRNAYPVGRAGAAVPTLEHDLENTLAAIAVNKAVLVTTASKEFANVLANWLCHVKSLKMPNVLVVALDEETALQVRAAGVATLWDQAFNRADGTIGTFASKSYLQAVYSKTRHQRAVLAAGYDLFFSDTDIPWTHDWVGEATGWALKDSIDIVRLHAAWSRENDVLCVACKV